MGRDGHGTLGYSDRPTLVPPGVRPGALVNDTYRLSYPLGHGAMGVVYRAHDLALDRPVAVKFILPELVEEDDARERFVREARLMARVHDANVVEIYAFGELDGAPYFAMEYVEGATVEEWLREFGRPHLAVDEALGILDQTCSGVHAIHAAGAAHRDLKPANVLVGPAFRVCVTDFGLGRALGQGLHAGRQTVSGTPAYLAPEVISGEAVPPDMEPRVDVYALGVMAFELLTSRLPFEVDAADEMLRMHVEDAPPRPSELRPDLPPGFDAAILAALEKDPEKRTPTAAALRRALIEAREEATAPAAPSILIADDDEDFRALVEETLRYAFEDATVRSAVDGSEALAIAEQHPPTLAIFDLDMPGLNGVELTAAFRASAKLAHVPILVLTATGGAPDWRLLSSMGAAGFLVKPIDPLSLVSLARRTLID